MELRASTPAVQSSRPSVSRLSSLHIVVSSFAAIAGVALAAYQVFAPAPAPQQAPVNVTVAIDPQKIATATTEQPAAAPKANPEPGLALDARATYSAALKDGSDQRYDFDEIFDGRPDTYLTLVAPDSEINVMVTFNDPSPHAVTEIEYQPPPGADPARLATILDVMVLPDGQLEASGRPVTSFRLPAGSERQTFALPTPEQGKGVWLRIAGPPGTTDTIIGDFRILRSN